MSKVKLSAEQMKIAAGVAKKLGVNVLYANTKEGEFFTDKNRALLSEDNDANAVAELSFVEEDEVEEKVTKPTRAQLAKLKKATEVVQENLTKAQEAFDAATDKDEPTVNAALSTAKEVVEKADAEYKAAVEAAGE